MRIIKKIKLIQLLSNLIKIMKCRDFCIYISLIKNRGWVRNIYKSKKYR